MFCYCLDLVNDITGIQVLSNVEVVIQLLSHFYPRLVKTTKYYYYTAPN
jgi:hypothetical protein